MLKLFGPSEIVHSYYTCNKYNCFSFTEREQKKNSALKRDRFKHQWIRDHNLAFDSCTGMWWVIYKEESDDEKEGMFCLLCKKHNSAHLKNNSKVYNLKTDALKDYSKSAQHAAAVQAEMLSRVSIFHKEVKESVKSKDEVLQMHLCQYTGWLKKRWPTRSFYHFSHFSKCLGLKT